MNGLKEVIVVVFAQYKVYKRITNFRFLKINNKLSLT